MIYKELWLLELELGLQQLDVLIIYYSEGELRIYFIYVLWFKNGKYQA